MSNYGYTPPNDPMIKIDIQTSITNDSNNKFKKYKNYSSEQSTDTSYHKSKNRSTKTIKVTNWSIKLK